ncbi:single-stranded DNA-binding protein [Candidatus Saccharibacteria bacterium]|nr:single-stranded DNA-binding protein [Candidatus Saccharibacteria bacterium]
MLKVELIGNLGADVEIKESNGSKFATFRVANTERFKAQNGEDKSVTNWVDCTFNNLESKVLEYLKAGVKVFVRGSASLRVYSSKKDRCMKAGLQIAVSEIELCGGNNDAVPRQLVDPDSGALYDTHKFYWCNAATKGMKKEDTRPLTDVRGGQYLMDYRGFVAPIIEDSGESTGEAQNEKGDAK